MFAHKIKTKKKFSGTPEKVVNFLAFVAMEVREILASLDYKSLKEVIGRTDLLHQVSRGSPNLDDLDFNPLLVQADPEAIKFSENNLINPVPDNNIDEKTWADIKNELKKIVKKIFYRQSSKYR